MNNTKGKAILTTLVLSAMAASTFAAGVNNTVDPNAVAYGAESYGKDNAITSTGTSAFAVGFENTVSGANSLVYGHNNKATGANSFAGGENSEAKGYASLAIGSSSQALKDYTFAIGSQARAAADNTVAIGNGAYANKDNALALGAVTSVDGKDSIALGSHVRSNSDNNVAIGTAVTTNSNDSVAVGTAVTTNSNNSVGIGNHVTNNLGNSIGIGNGVATDFNTIGIGNGVETKVQDTIAIGNGVISDGESSVAIGNAIHAEGVKTVNIGTNVNAKGVSSIVIGRDTTVNGDDTTVVGANNGFVNADQSVVVGYNNVVQDASKEQLIFGVNSTTKEQGSTVVGSHSKATAVDSLALGNNTIADVQNGVAIGTNSVTESPVGTTNIKDNTTDIRFSNSTYAGSNPDSVVSFGTHGRAGAGGVTEYTRQLQNLAAGRVSATSTDGINGSQLYDVALEAQKHNTLVDGTNTIVTSQDNAFGRKEYKVNVNRDLTNMNSVQFNTVNDPQRNFVTKDGMHVFNGDVNTNYGPDGIKLENTDNLDTAEYNMDGININSNGKNVKFGTDGISAGDQIINNVKAGVADTDAVNVAQLNGLRKDVEDLADAQNQVNTAVENTLANHKTAINNAMAEAKKHTTVVAGDNVAVSEGTNAAGGKEYTVSVKKDLTDMSSVAFGKNTDPKHAVATKDGLIAFDGDVDTKHDANGVTIENRNTLDTASYGIDGMTASGANGTVSFTTTNVDVAGNQIHNVATGTAGTDAVNVDQLNSVVAANKAVESVVADNQVDNIAAVRVTNGKSTGDANATYGVYVSKNTVRDIAKDAVTFKGDDVIKVTRQVNENGADVVTTTYNGGNAAKVTPLTYKANGGAANTTNLAAGLDFTNGNNTTASVAANGVVKFDLNKDLKGLDSAKFNGGVVINNDGINAGNKTITNVAAGQNGTDAVNVNQLTSAIDQVNSNASKLGNVVRANQEEARKGIAGTAALAGLHPLDFDPDHKLDIMAGYGHFHNANAGAVGIAYRPNEDLMFTAGTTFGSDNVINAGVTYKVGARSEVSRSKVAMAKDLAEAKKEIAQLQSDNAKFKAILNAVLGLDLPQEANTVFPDIEENHWAYVAVDDMAKRGLLVGYPDGTFKGDRAVTRYEFAEVIHRAIEKAKELGQTVDSRLVEEFKPELMRYAVEGKKLERVHVNKSTKEVKRDQYGTIITK